MMKKLTLALSGFLLCTSLSMTAQAQNNTVEGEYAVLREIVAEVKSDMDLPIDFGNDGLVVLKDIYALENNIVGEYEIAATSEELPQEVLMAIASDSGTSMLCNDPEWYSIYYGMDVKAVYVFKLTDKTVKLQFSVKNCPQE